MTQSGEPPVFTGVGVALVTLFAEDGSVDPAATADLAVRLVETGLTSVVVAGSTGEAAALTAEERVALVRAVRAALPAGVPVIAGTGAQTGALAAEQTRQAVDAGADAVLVLTPHRVADPRPYYERVLPAAGSAPMLGYHFPAASSPGIPVPSLADLPVRGIKDSSGDAERLLEELEVFPGDIYVGSTAVALLGGALGVTGAIFALANAEPDLCIAAFGGDSKAQRELLGAHLTAKRGFPTGIKKLTADRFGTSQVARIGS